MDKHKNATKTVDYTTIADRFRWLVEVTTVIQLVFLNRFAGTEPSY